MRANEPLRALGLAHRQVVVDHAKYGMRTGTTGLDVELFVSQRIVESCSRSRARDLVGRCEPDLYLAALAGIVGIPRPSLVEAGGQVDQNGLSVPKQEPVLLEYRDLPERIDLAQELIALVFASWKKFTECRS